jgi:hypothetical protein
VKMLAVLVILALVASSFSATATTSCPCSRRQQQGHQQQQPGQEQPHSQQPHQQQQRPQKPHQQEPHQQEPHQQWHGQQQQQWQPQQCHQGEQQMPQGGYSSGSYRANLNQCREFLWQQCSPAAMRFLQSRLLPPSRCEVLRRKCCQQLKQVEPQYRQQAINDMVLSIMEQQPQQEEQQGGYQQGGAQGQTMTMVEAAQMTLQLPAMCSLQQPSYGAIPFGYGTSPFGYGASPFGMAAGGMYQPGYGTSPFGMAGGGMS